MLNDLQERHFYFVKDSFYDRVNDGQLMYNKGRNHQRPCYCVKVEGDIAWLVPVTSQFETAKRVYDRCVEKYGRCDTVVLGWIGGERGGLMLSKSFPITKNFVSKEVLVASDQPYYLRDPLRISPRKEAMVERMFNKILYMWREKKCCLFSPDWDKILKFLDDNKVLCFESNNIRAFYNGNMVTVKNTETKESCCFIEDRTKIPDKKSFEEYMVNWICSRTRFG